MDQPRTFDRHDRLLLLLQLVDSAFPTGGFAHSGGVEAAMQVGRIEGDHLEPWLADAIDNAGWSQLPLVNAAYDMPGDLPAIDRFADATMPNHIANRASRAQGQALINTAAGTFALADLTDLRRHLRADRRPGHLAPAWGAIAAHLGLARDTTQRCFLFQHLRGLLSAAVRLNLVGPLAAQAMQHQLLATVDAVAERCADLGIDDCVTTAPMLDLYQGHHDRLYSRLFSS